MVEKEKILKEKVKYSGLGNFKDAYKYLYSKIESEGFALIEDSYSEKISGSSKEIEVEWSANKKVSDYFKYSLKVKWDVKGMSDVEVELDGKKKNMNKFADLAISFTGTLEKDYESKWEGTNVQRFLKEAYHKYVIPQRLASMEDGVRSMVQDLKEDMKAFFELNGRKGSS